LASGSSSSSSRGRLITACAIITRCCSPPDSSPTRVCGRTAEVDGREVWEWARQVAFLAGFTLTGHTVQLTGVCAAHAVDAQDAQTPGTRELVAAGRGQVPDAAGP
jgi:hypothetical protein